MAVTLAAPVIGTARVGQHRVRVQRRDGSRGVWLTLLGRREFDDIALGTIGDVASDDPTVRIFQRCTDWDNVQTHQLLLAAVRPLFDADETRRAASRGA